MGCNFYTLKGRHIGKRSAAGMYCWDCKQTLCMGGEEKVHYSEYGWYEVCPNCGKKTTKETLENGAVGRELGFNKRKPAPKHGVKSCSSFSWAMRRSELKVRKVKDEYDREYTRQEFDEVLLECPIQYTNSIGVDFS